MVEIVWEKNYGGSSSDALFDAIPTSDSSFIFTGFTESIDEDVNTFHGSLDVWICKIDSLGMILWENSYGGTNVDYAGCIVECTDHGFIISGYSYSNDGDIVVNNGSADCWILKIDSIGNLEWQTSIGGSQFENATSIIQTSDSGFIFTGYSHSEDGDLSEHFGSSDVADLIVFKLDKFGNILWNRVFGGVYDDFGTSITITNDGDYLICGTTNLYDYFDYWVIKLDSEGNLIWDKSYGGSEYDVAYAILETTNNNILITGESSSDDGDVEFHHPGENKDMWTLLLDSVGEIIWQRSLGGAGADEGHSLLECNDGTYIIAGNTTTLDDGDVSGHHGGMFYADYWVVKLDSSGVIKWQKCLGGSNSDFAFSINKSSESSYLISGYAWSDDGDITEHYIGDIPATDIWVVQISETCDQIVYYTDSDNDLFGDAENYIYSCYDTLGYVWISGDCDDTNPDIYPGAAEILNGLDDDCNGLVDDNVSVDDLMGGFSIYPNPVKDVLFINNNSGSEATFTISTLTGQIIYKSDPFSFNTDLSLSSYSSGLYLITIYTKNNRFLIELIKE